MKRVQLYAIVREYAAMPDLGAQSTAKFDYFSAKNDRIARQEIKDLETTLKPSEEWTALEQERGAINQKHAKRDEKGEFVLESVNGGQRYTFDPEAAVARDAEMAQLDTDKKEVIARRQKVLEDFNTMLEEEVTTESLGLHRIKLSDMPALGKRAAVWEQLIDP